MGVKKALPTEQAEQQFEALGEQILEEAARINCSVESYRDGLRHMISQLETELQANREALGERD